MESIKELEKVHPFYGHSFLVCKKEGNLPIGSHIEFDFYRELKYFLEQYYKPEKNSEYYFRALKKGADKRKNWLKPDYASSGAQSTITREFGVVFIHNKKTQLWGWEKDYIEKLKLKMTKPIPTFHLAVWLYREKEWSSEKTGKDIIETFFEEFNISQDEKSELFDTSYPEKAANDLFQQEKASWEDLKDKLDIDSPPDAPKEKGGTLSFLKLIGVGPAKEIQFEPAERINLLTGDNGLGKTFLLESAWWALTGNWTSSPIYPRQDAKKNEPKIIFEISGAGSRSKKSESPFNWEKQEWISQRARPTIPGLMIYARVDGAFAIWDPAKNTTAPSSNTFDESIGSLILTKESIWDGLRITKGGVNRFLCNGLITDWVNWQNNQEMYPFETLKNVFRRLSPPDLTKGDLGPLVPGIPTRIPGDSRLIPTLSHPYGDVPILFASAGVKRIISLAYLIVWAWYDHKEQSKLIHEAPQSRMVILIDEIEAHLHPQWQRKILPALIGLQEELQSAIQIQFLIATHSPLVMASVEPVFDIAKDKIFHLELKEGEGAIKKEEVNLKELSFVRHGRVDTWLMSDAFNILHARSLEAEEAIECAKALQLRENVKKDEVQEITNRLIKLLAGDDSFWPRWTFFAEKHGVKI